MWIVQSFSKMSVTFSQNKFVLRSLKKLYQVSSPRVPLISVVKTFSQNLLEELKKEKKQLLHEVEEFEAKTNELEQQLKETQEKLQLVIEFPSIDAKQSSQSDKAVIFNGDNPSEAEVAKDMERQVMANNIRILTLEEQNEKLRKSITFLMNARENMSKKKVWKELL